MLANAFAKFVPPEAAARRSPLWVDCACGVGYPIAKRLSERLGSLLNLTLANGVGEGELNAGCGAEYVQKGRLPPKGFESAEAAGQVERACSLDGDADRLVYHYWRPTGFTAKGAAAYLAAHGVEEALQSAVTDAVKERPADPLGAIASSLRAQRPAAAQDAHAASKAGAAAAEGDGVDGGAVGGGMEWRLLDGDKIAALFASFACDELRTLNLQPPLSMAVVQTAYANGASGAYIRSLGVQTRLAKTGVKHVHHVAVGYDVSVYFEANGHVGACHTRHTSLSPPLIVVRVCLRACAGHDAAVGPRRELDQGCAGGGGARW